jgi:probable DNA metabolism protein
MITYVIEPSLNGILAAFYRCCKDKVVPDRLVWEDEMQTCLEEQVVYPILGEEHRGRILIWFENLCGREAFEDLIMAADSGEPEKYGVILKFLLLVYKYGGRTKEMKNLPVVIAYDRLARRVWYEFSRLAGFVRFRQVEALESDRGTAFDLLYGAYRSDNDLLYRLAMYFADRNGSTPFVLHDVDRELAMLYNGEAMMKIRLPKEIEVQIGAGEKNYDAMFHLYIKKIAIEARENSRLQRQFLPVRYRDMMNEFHPLTT